MEIVLPGQEYVLLKWTVRPGSAVRAGDMVATAVRKGSNTASLPSTPEPAMSKHIRPTKGKRKRDEGKSQEGPPSSDKLLAPPSLPQHLGVVSVLAPAAGILKIEKLSPSSFVIGKIEPCSHPAIMGGLCAVCGEAIGPPKSQTTLNQNSSLSPKSNMSQVTVSGGVTMIVSEKEAQLMSQQTSERLTAQKKLSLVLDLDHTLVHATADVRAQAHLPRDDVRSLILPMMEDRMHHPSQMWMQHFVKLRPHVKEFLEESHSLYEISVYTAGTRSYAEQITMVLSRFMVGSTTDHDDLQRLRHEVARAEYEFMQSQGKGESAVDETATKNQDQGWHEKSNGNEEKKNGQLTGNTEDEPQKRVTFGEPPPTSKTDQTTLLRLEELREELQVAEQLESDALALRQQIFGSRIVSRTDVGDLGRDVKSLKRIFPCGGTMAVIVDDREDVWANAEDSAATGEPPENLLLARPYHWKPFLGFADVNNAAGSDLSGDSPDEAQADESDEQLLWIVDILKRVHMRFYSSSQSLRQGKLTVPQVLKEMRLEVLSGCTLVLSGLVPLHKQNRGKDSPRPPVVRYAENLGAEISESVNDMVTHVVAARDGTDKIARARRIRGCVIVKASWLMECFWSVTRRDEQPHLLGPWSATGSLPTPSRTPLIPYKVGNDSSSSSDDDDDLAAELEAKLIE